MLGFALMKMPRALNVAYERSPLVQQNLEEFRRFREAFNKIDPAAYRGIERCALSEIPEPDPGWVQPTPPITLAGIDEKVRRACAFSRPTTSWPAIERRSLGAARHPRTPRRRRRTAP